jgi:PIN domain nuclease of toxin-antitoxin system
VKALLDTHVFVWWINDDPRLSTPAREVIASASVDLLFSSASAWEIAVKSALGKLEVRGDLVRFIPEQLERNQIRVLPVELDHALGVASLPHYHRDPFDRLLVSQCQLESIPLITGDELIRRYHVEVIW